MGYVRRVFLVDEDVMRKFRTAVAKQHGYYKGAISKEFNEALKDRTAWLEGNMADSGRTRVASLR